MQHYKKKDFLRESQSFPTTKTYAASVLWTERELQEKEGVVLDLKMKKKYISVCNDSLGHGGNVTR